MITRTQWKAAPPKRTPEKVSLDKRTEFVLHYSTGEELGREDTAKWVREIQAFHQGSERKWNDIGYNFLVDAYGNKFEGRGWDVVGAHAPGHNTVGIGVCFLGNDDPKVQDVPWIARKSIKELYDEACDRAGRELRRLGHRDTKSTTCPGDELYAWLVGGMKIGTSPKPKPNPPAPSPQPKEPVMYYVVQEPDGPRQYITNGVTKWHVPTPAVLKEVFKIFPHTERISMSAATLAAIPTLQGDIP